MADTPTNTAATNPTTADDKTKSTAKEVAQKAPDATPKVDTDTGANGQIKPVVAVNLINGKIQPGTPFRPKDAQELADLEALKAVRDLSDAETALFAKLEAEPASNDSLLG